MTVTGQPHVLAAVEQAPRDPILGLTEQFVADERPGKVNLGVGVYLDEHGKVPLLRCVDEVQQRLARQAKPYGYLPIDGLAAYDRAVAEMIFGRAVARERVAVVQSLGGTGALKVAADFLHQLLPGATAWLSDPSWENHAALFGRAGFSIARYAYYDADSHAADVDAMVTALASATAGDVVILHACCHNPTGCDLTLEQWQRVLRIVQERGLIPLLDMAYQGFAESLEADSAPVRLFAEAGITTFVTSSFSKTFSLYGERVGALSVVCADADEAKRVLSRLKIIVRTTYSNPPTHGATIVATVLTDPSLRQQWVDELGAMRERIKQMRGALADRLDEPGVPGDVGYIRQQNGMFSYSGLSVEQMRALRRDHAVYGLDSGRLCVAALNPDNLERVVAAIAAVSADA